MSKINKTCDLKSYVQLKVSVVLKHCRYWSVNNTVQINKDQVIELYKQVSLNKIAG